jgi:hypothetical protein
VHTIKLGRFALPLPRHPILRTVVGVALVIGGLLGFLPVLGFWMIPLGIVVLSIDFPAVRRWRRTVTVRFGVWLNRNWPKLAEKMGFSGIRDSKI